MSPLDKIGAEFFHHAALLPLATLVVLWVRKMKVVGWYWALALAFSVSWFADLAMSMLSKSGHNPWIVSYIFPSVQLGIMYGLLLEKRLAIFVLMGLGLLMVTTISQGPTDSPETVLKVSNGLFVSALAYQRPDLGLSRMAIVIYFGLGALFQTLFPWLMAKPDMFLVNWLAYQGCRMTGLTMATLDIIANKRPRLALA